MPEGPEVEVVRQSLEEVLLHQRIARVKVSDKALRRPVTQKDFNFLKGAVVQQCLRRGKFLYCLTGPHQGFWCRLGMAGKLLWQNKGAPLRPHSHVVLHFDNGQRLAYVDPRRFGELVPFPSLAMLETELQKLGPDPLSWSEPDKQRVVRALGQTKRQIKVALLDQGILSGVGNIYACEALFEAHISPFRQSKSLNINERFRLLNATEAILKRAVAHGGTTFSDYEQPDGSAGDNFNHRQVFQRDEEPCHQCNTPIKSRTQHGRSTFFCPRCQKTRG
ncbi:MAG: formamidopyrimidine-DNA glycosylase [Myxococcales bacterium]|nr:formamidopyrimidine-DNA glycosylase [Myxococcales bacterium]|tara:strand:- start:1277 stop:2107 length:831 start_codon:yes stop_codon:yes gene_type:complete